MFSLEGRVFTLGDLKAAILAASGHKLTSTYWEIWESDLWLYEVIEVIEMITEANRKSSPDVDLADLVDL